MKRHWRFVVVAGLLAGAALLLQARNSHEVIPSRAPLDSFPRSFDNWSSRDLPLSKDVLDILGSGDFLMRRYHQDIRNQDVDLFIAYFPSQRAGDTIHSPKNCLPGSGWFPVQAGRITVNVPGHAPFTANQYFIAKGDSRQLVLYWYLAHGRAVADEYAAKIYLVSDSIRMHRSDGSLIRLSTPLTENEDLGAAQQLLLSFTNNIVPLANTYVPR